MRWLKKPHLKPPIHISIRAQLTALVSLVAIVSLVILAIITGVYFTSNYRNLRSGQLYIAAQLKASQIDQTLNYLYFQCYYLSSRDTLQTALINYVAGNKSSTNWEDTATVVAKFLGSSDLFYVASVYDVNFNIVVNATNNGTGDLVPENILQKLLPLSRDTPLPSSLSENGLLVDPVPNGTSYLMSMSLPIFANPSIILSDSRVYGYITIIMSAEGLRTIFNDTTALEKSSVEAVSAIYANSSVISSFHFIFPPWGSDDSNTIFNIYPLKNNTFLSSSFRQAKGGSVKKTRFFFNKEVAIGYSPCTFNLVNWVAIVTQAESVFSSPSTKLERIIIGVVIGIAAFVCLVTLPLSHWAVKPIVRLQKATELISEGRGLRHDNTSNSGHGWASRSNSFKWRSSIESMRSSRILNGIREKVTSSTSSPSQEATTPASVMSNTSARNSQVIVQDNVSNNTSDADRFSYDSSKLTTSANLNEARIPVYRKFIKDELSELTETFNTMTDALDQHYALLEHRVRARTKQLEAAKIEAEAANEAKTVFIANISHELRTPLNGILGMTAISMEETDVSKIKDSLKLIFRSGELLLHILTELLTFSKNVLKRTNLEKRNFCITEVALQIKSIFGKVARDQHVRLSIILSPNVIRTMVLCGDSNRIIQIVMNLVSNALKFTPVDGNVDVRIRLLGKYDQEKSARAKFQKVFIKEGTEIHDDDNDMRIRKEVLDLSKSKVKEHTTQSANMQKKEHEEAHDERSDSVSTSSGSSYDDTVFYKQFQKNVDGQNGDSNEYGVELETPETWVFSMEVQDTGPGIDPKLHKSVFEPFVQGDQALSRQYGGTGLGLSICKQLATMMNGTMELESTVGVGSKFIFTVPLTQVREIQYEDDDDVFEDEFNANSKKNRKVKFKVAHSIKSRNSVEKNLSDAAKNAKTNYSRPFLQSTGTATSSQTVPTIKGSISSSSNIHEAGAIMDEKEPASVEAKHINILVAEDNHVNQEVIRRMLLLEKLEDVELACDGQVAFDKVKELADAGESYDLIFMDVQMPKVDGLASTRMIRRDLLYEGPIVALTAFANAESIKECLDAGMNGFLAKPIKRQQLKDILQEFCYKETA